MITQPLTTPTNTFHFGKLIFVLLWIPVLIQISHIILYYLLTQLPIGYALKYNEYTVIKNSVMIGGIMIFGLWAVVTVFLKDQKHFEYAKNGIYPLAVALALEILVAR